MTINQVFTPTGLGGDHPANGPLSIERLIRVRDELASSLEYAEGSNRDRMIADAVKAIHELLTSRERIAELEAREETLRPVGVMSEKAFNRLEGSESRFIALWPRPGIYLPRKRPDDGVIVYARTAAGISIKGE